MKYQTSVRVITSNLQPEAFPVGLGRTSSTYRKSRAAFLSRSYRGPFIPTLPGAPAGTSAMRITYAPAHRDVTRERN